MLRGALSRKVGGIRWPWLFGLGVFCPILMGCRTIPFKPEAPPVEKVAEFEPAYYASPIAFAEGRYADLFGPESYAVWVGPEVTERKRESAVEAGEFVPEQLETQAATITDHYVVIECHMESQFGDMSAAYDVVGFRGARVYLEMPDGRTLAPIQKVIGSPLEEEQRGALKLFRRTNLLIFPRRDLWFGQVTLDPTFASVKLVVDAHNSRFVFEWPETAYADPTRVPPPEQDFMREVKLGFSELFNAVSRAAHVFD